MKDRLIQILKEFKSITDVTGLEVAHEILFNKAVDIYLMEKVEANKDNRTTQINKHQFQKNNYDGATQPQLSLLFKLGYTGTKDITKAEASQLIKEFKSKKENKSDESYDNDTF